MWSRPTFLSNYSVYAFLTTRPYIYKKLKFDLRIYVLLLGCDPLRILIYKDGIVRFATSNYEKPSAQNRT